MNLLADFPQQPLSVMEEQNALAKGDYENIVMHAMIHAVRYCERRNNGLTRAEIVSLCYAGLTNAVKNFKPGRQRFFSYACVYLRSKIFAAQRDRESVKNAYRHETPIADGKTPQPLEADSVDPDLDNFHWRELWEKIEPLIRGLAPREKTVLELHYRFGLNFRMIGEKMGLTRSRVHQIERAAILKLRKLLPEGLSL